MPRVIPVEDVNLYDEHYNQQGRQSFWAYEQLIQPDMLLGWWQKEVAQHLQQFYQKMIAGERPTLVLATPPQHGKTEQVTNFAAWLSGKHPDYRVIYTSYSDEMGDIVNTRLQRIFDGPRHRQMFGQQIADRGGGIAQRNSHLLEYINGHGSFRNTTVLGQITGMGLDLGIIDDPLKGREAAQSKVIRDKTWSWFTDDFFSRFSERAGMLMIMTRWSVDDPVGRFAEHFPNAVILRYPALAIEDELHRRKGEPLFPELKSLDFLLARRRVMTSSSWEGLYQQNPIIAGGDMFKREWFDIVEAVPNDCRWVRHWDLAASENDGAFTAGVLMGESKSMRKYYIADVKRVQYTGENVRRLIMQTAKTDEMQYGRGVYISLPQDPGQAGKVQAQDLIYMLRSFNVHAERESGDKITRAEPFAAQCEAGNVMLLRGRYIHDLLSELEVVPNGKYMDQVDACSGAFGVLVTTQSEKIYVGAVKGLY